jgi:multidrug efflux system membrane fusion protein
MNPSQHDSSQGTSQDRLQEIDPKTPLKKGSFKWIKWLLLLVVTALLVWRFYPHAEDASTHSKSRRGLGNGGPVPVTLATAITEEFPIYLNGLGTVQAFNSVLVNARVSGQIQEIRFQEGQEVKQGDVLAIIDPRTYQAQYDQAVSKKLQDVAQLQSAQVLMDRDKSLLEKNVLDHQTFDTQRYLVAQLEATVKADDANVELQKTQLDYTRVTAPISGRTGVKQVDVGNQVTVGGNMANGASSIVTINQIQPIYVAFTLPQQSLPEIREPMLARKSLQVTALDRNNQTPLATGVLSVVDNQIDTSTATVKLKAVFDNEDYKLWPGQFVNVRLLVGKHPDALVVPTEAVQLGPEGSYVYVVGESNTAEMRPVATGGAEAGLTLIESGIKAGEKVVVDGQYRLQPNSPVSTASAKTGSESGSRHHKTP